LKKPAIAGFFNVGLGRQPSFFLLFGQEKETKEKATPCLAPSGFPALRAKPGGGLNSLRSDNAHRLLPSWLCCSARQQGNGVVCHRCRNSGGYRNPKRHFEAGSYIPFSSRLPNKS
jgi:hypothetical protein